MDRVANPGNRFLSIPKRPDRLWNPRNHLYKENHGCFPGIKWPGRETVHSPLYRAQVKNDFSHNSPPPICLRVGYFTTTVSNPATFNDECCDDSKRIWKEAAVGWSR